MNKNIWKNYIYSYVSENNLIDFYTSFLEMFEREWKQFISSYEFTELCQLNNGNRLRPMLVYWGYLLNRDNETLFNINEQDISFIIKPCIMIEAIHKMSLLLDDWIDGDVARHGATAFHVIYGADTAVLFALNVLIKGFLELNSSTIKEYEKTLPLALKISYDMTIGALDEVSSGGSDFDIDKVKQIISLETSSIIRNGIVIGYIAGKGTDTEIINLLDDIGYCCGYIFQALNDMEPFGNAKELVKHKGALTTDFIKNRKNIVVAYVFAWANQKETEKLTSLEDCLSVTNYILFLIDKYDIKNHLMEEISDLQLRIQDRIEKIEKKTGCFEWCKHFKGFIDITISASKERASC